MRTALSAAIALCAIAVLPLRAAAQTEGSLIYLSALAGYALFDEDDVFPDAELDDTFHVGGRLGWRFGSKVGLELAGGWSPTQENVTDGSDVTYLHTSLNLIATPGWTRFGGPFVSLGGGYSRRDSDDAPDDLHYGTFELAGGWQAWMSPRLGLRLEARNVLNVPHEDFDDANKNQILFLGGLTLANGGAPRDSDSDGVPDSKDKCPATPAGARVDENGCPTDADQDRVADGIDQCPDTPRGATVDARGCPTDADADGVPDGIDTCADTPRGATVDARGCPADADGDGVFDGIDACPGTARGVTVDARGCPRDSDGDGVMDGVDTCPDTPANARVDAKGCPIEVTERETELLDTGMIRLQDVNFETGKAEILPESHASLDVVGQVLSKWPALKIEIGGHTDSRGSAAYNQRLSEQRAQAVLQYLTSKFPNLKPDQFTVRGYGESKPIAANNSDANMAKNRRVEFVVLNKEVLRIETERRRQLQR